MGSSSTAPVHWEALVADAASGLQHASDVQQQGHAECSDVLAQAYGVIVKKLENSIAVDDWDTWHELQTLVSAFSERYWEGLDAEEVGQHVAALLLFAADSGLLEEG